MNQDSNVAQQALQQDKPMTYGELQHNLLTGIPVYMSLTYGMVPTTIEVQIIHAVGYASGYDNIDRATVIWKHTEFDNNQIDIVEMSKLYTKSEE